jgi:hypothetical protein
MGIRCADFATPLYPEKLAITLQTSSGLSIVRLQTQATESRGRLRRFILCALGIGKFFSEKGYLVIRVPF